MGGRATIYTSGAGMESEAEWGGERTPRTLFVTPKSEAPGYGSGGPDGSLPRADGVRAAFVPEMRPYRGFALDPLLAKTTQQAQDLAFNLTLGGKSKVPLGVDAKTGSPSLSEVLEAIDQVQLFAALHEGRAPHYVALTGDMRRIMLALSASTQEAPFDERQVPNLLMKWVELNGTTVEEAIKEMPKLEFGSSLSDANINFCVTLFSQQVGRAFRMVARAHWTDPNARTRSVWAIVDKLPMVVQAQMREAHALARGAPVPATVTLDGLMESIKMAFAAVVARLKAVGKMEELRVGYKPPVRSGDAEATGARGGTGTASSRGRGGRANAGAGGWNGRGGGRKPAVAVAAVEVAAPSDKVKDEGEGEEGETEGMVAAVSSQAKGNPASTPESSKPGCPNCRGAEEYGPAAKPPHRFRDCPVAACLFWQYNGGCKHKDSCAWAKSHTPALKGSKMSKG
jgi:hypothetical protein